MEPKNALWRHNRATVYNHMGKYNLAIADIDAGIKLLPKYGALYLEKVASLYNLGRYKDALVAAQKAVTLMPGSSSAYANLGKVYLKFGELQKAKESFDKAITYNNKNTDAYNNRARIYIKLGNLKAAIADLDKSISVNPKSRSAFQMRGEIFMKLGNEEQALQDFDRSKQLLADLTRSSEAPSEKTLKDIRQGYTLAIDKKTNSGAAYYDRGCINFCLANYKSASDDFGQYTSAKGAGEKAKVRATIFRIIAEMLDGNTVNSDKLLKTIGSSSWT